MLKGKKSLSFNVHQSNLFRVSGYNFSCIFYYVLFFVEKKIFVHNVLRLNLLLYQ